jgi:hypothetical protein
MRVFMTRARICDEYKSTRVLQACAVVSHQEICINASGVSEDSTYPRTTWFEATHELYAGLISLEIVLSSLVIETY